MIPIVIIYHLIKKKILTSTCVVPLKGSVPYCVKRMATSKSSMLSPAAQQSKMANLKVKIQSSRLLKAIRNLSTLPIPVSAMP